MRIGEFFRAKRIEKGLSENEVANQIKDGFQSSLFYDFELRDDNDIDGLSICDYKKYCSILDIPATSFADIPATNLYSLKLSELIKSRRTEKGYSIDDLAERIGYDSIVVVALENDEYDDVVLDVIKGVAYELDLPLRLLLEKI